MTACFTPETLHICGCVTKFDTERWRSVAVHRCADHALLDPSWRLK